MTYYTMKGLSIPNDVKYRDVIYPDVTGRVNTLLSSLETQYAGAKNLRYDKKLAASYKAVNTGSALDVKTSWGLNKNPYM